MFKVACSLLRVSYTRVLVCLLHISNFDIGLVIITEPIVQYLNSLTKLLMSI